MAFDGNGRRFRPAFDMLEARDVPALLATQRVLTPPTLSTGQVQQLLSRAAAATASNDAIISIVDRGGRLLGVFVEAGVSPAITGNHDKLVFAIDGAVAKARTAAFFSTELP